MGFLSPLFLLAAAAIAVPVFLHLFPRHEAKRFSFPALRYLVRTEREHARRIRLRQIVLLILRVAVVMLLVGAGSRLFLNGAGSAHPPTALAIVLDNSMSSGLVTGDERVLDRLKALAGRTLDDATDEDRVWVIRAGQPWQPSVPVSPSEARQMVEETTVSAARGDLSATLARAAELVGTSRLAAREIHLLSDLQSTAFDPAAPLPPEDLPLVVFGPEAPVPGNRALAEVTVGGGLPPLEGQGTQITVRVSEGTEDDTVSTSVRVVLDGRVRGAGSAPPGAALSLPLPPAPAGWVLGYADSDPDDLGADDRRYFAFRARPAPRVAVAGDPGRFLVEAVSVLAAAGLLRRVEPSGADVILSAGGEGLEAAGSGAAVLVIPPVDPTTLPGLNRRLADGGVPWWLERDGGEGIADLEGLLLPEALEGVSIARRYRLELSGDPPAPSRSLAEASGIPWAVEGTDTEGRRYLLLASALDEASTTLPVSAGMIRFVEWVVGEWAAVGGGPVERVAGEVLTAPRGADRIRLPSGVEVAVDGTRLVRATGETGFYSFLSSDSVVAVAAVNAPAEESDLRRLEGRELRDRLGPDVVLVRDAGDWAGAVFRQRRGPELWWLLVGSGLLLLLVEARVAAAGSVRRAGRPVGAENEGARGIA